MSLLEDQDGAPYPEPIQDAHRMAVADAVAAERDRLLEALTSDEAVDRATAAFYGWGWKSERAHRLEWRAAGLAALVAAVDVIRGDQ